MTDDNIDDTVGLLDEGAPIVSVLILISFGIYLHMSSVLVYKEKGCHYP